MGKYKSKRIDYPLWAKKVRTPQYKYGVFYRATGDRVSLFRKKTWKNEAEFKTWFNKSLLRFRLSEYSRVNYQEAREVFKNTVTRFIEYYHTPCIVESLSQDELTKFGFESSEEFDKWLGKPSNMTVFAHIHDKQMWFADVDAFYDFTMTALYEFKEF